MAESDDMMSLLMNDKAWADMLIVSKWDWPRRVFVVCPVCCSIVLDEARLTHIAWHNQYDNNAR